MGKDGDGRGTRYYRQGIPAIDLYIERDTDRTPDPRRFYVFECGVPLEGGYRSLREAEAKYRELRAVRGYGAGPGAEYEYAGLAKDERRQLIAREAQEEIVARTELFWIDYRGRSTHDRGKTGRDRGRR